MADYSYLISRLRARKAEIFHKKDYENLLSLNSVEGIRDFLRAGYYGPYIEAASSNIDDSENIILYALKQQTTKLFEFIWEYKQKGEEYLLKFLFSKWEIYNLKLILRKIYRNIKAEEFYENFIPAGEFTERRIENLSRLNDISSVTRYLINSGSPYGTILQTGLDRHTEEGFYRDLEINLDRLSFSYFKNSLNKWSQNGRALENFIGLKIDIVNILILLKNLGEAQTDIQHSPIKSRFRREQFIDGGRHLDQQKFFKLLDLKSRDEFLRKLADTVKEPKISEILMESDPDDIIRTEERFEDYIEKYLFRRSLIDPHGFYFIASFLYMKMREVKNIRFILSCVKFSLNKDEIDAHLLYPLINAEKRSA